MEHLIKLITEKLKNLTGEFNPDIIKDIFYDLVVLDQNLYLDIISTMQVLVINKDEINRNEYAGMMYNVVNHSNENTMETPNKRDMNSEDWDGK